MLGVEIEITPGGQVHQAAVAALGRREVDDRARLPLLRFPRPPLPLLRAGRGGRQPTISTSTASSRCCAVTPTGRSSSSSPTRSARWRPPTGCMGCRWPTTASPRCSQGGCRPRGRADTAGSPPVEEPPRVAPCGIGRACCPREWSELFIAGVPPWATVHRLPRRRRVRAGSASAATLQAARAKTCRRPARRSAPEIQATLFSTLDEHTWERLEEASIMADVGASTTASVVETLETEATEGGLTSGARRSPERLIELLADTARSEAMGKHRHPREAPP